MLYPLPLEAIIKLMKKQYKPKNISIMKWKQFEKIGLLSAQESSYVSKPDDPACIVHTSGTTGSGLVFPYSVEMEKRSSESFVDQTRKEFVCYLHNERVPLIRF